MSIKYLNILKSIEIAERRKKTRTVNYKTEFPFLKIILFLVGMSLLMIIPYHIFKAEWIKLAALIFLLLAYLVLPMMPIYKAYQHRSKIQRTLTLPFNEAIDLNIKNKLIVDTEYFPALIALEHKTLHLGLLEVKHERACLEKRVTLLIGPIDKLGILPGIVATIAAMIKIPETYTWISAVSYGYIGLTLMSLFFFQLIMRYDRMIALTLLALEMKPKPAAP